MDNHQTSNALPDIRRTAVFQAPIAKVWEAVATSEGIAAWFMPNDFRPELGFEFQLNAGPFGMSPCKVTELDPPNRLSIKWGKDWQLTFELQEQGAATEFTLIHSGWDADKLTEFGQPHPAIRGMMDQGWGGMLLKLAAYLEA